MNFNFKIVYLIFLWFWQKFLKFELYILIKNCDQVFFILSNNCCKKCMIVCMILVFQAFIFWNVSYINGKKIKQFRAFQMCINKINKSQHILKFISFLVNTYMIILWIIIVSRYSLQLFIFE